MVRQMSEGIICLLCRRRSLMAIELILIIAALLVVCARNAQEPLQLKHQAGKDELCDLFQGEWVFDPYSKSPYSQGCPYLNSHQNCLKNGRPDEQYLHWRWRPYGCNLPPFDPEKFLTVMRNTSFAFIGDSVSRNHVESLLCLLSKVEEAELISSHDMTKWWYFPSYNFTLTLLWSPLLLKIEGETTNASLPFNLHLDVLDGGWTEQYHKFDRVLIGVGPWFDRYSFMLENNDVVGCHKCELESARELGQYYPFHRSLNLAFRFITTSDHKPLVIYRIHAPNHFEYGDWYDGGKCNRTTPFKEGEYAGRESDRQLQAIAREEFAEAVADARKRNGARLEILDIYHLSLLRPDGHPDKYRGTEGSIRDCLHWCMPGPIDNWSDLMMEMVFRNANFKALLLKE